MDLRTIEYFLVVVEEASITGAAARLHISQPPLTVRVKALEAELGVPLLTRHGRGVEPTAAGRAFAERARRLLADLGDTAAAVRSVGEGTAGTLTMAIGPSAGRGLLADLLARLRTQAPEVRIVVTDADEAVVRNRIADGEVDCGFVHVGARSGAGPRVPGLESAVVAREPLVAVLPDAHAAADQERADLAALGAGDLIMYSRTGATVLHDLGLALWRAAGGDPGRVREADSTSTALALVTAGFGTMLIPPSTRMSVWPGLCTRPLLQPHPPVETAVLWQAARASPVLARFLRIALATPEPDVLGPEHSRF